VQPPGQRRLARPGQPGEQHHQPAPGARRSRPAQLALHRGRGEAGGQRLPGGQEGVERRGGDRRDTRIRRDGHRQWRTGQILGREEVRGTVGGRHVGGEQRRTGRPVGSGQRDGDRERPRQFVRSRQHRPDQGLAAGSPGRDQQQDPGTEALGRCLHGGDLAAVQRRAGHDAERPGVLELGPDLRGCPVQVPERAVRRGGERRDRAGHVLPAGAGGPGLGHRQSGQWRALGIGQGQRGRTGQRLALPAGHRQHDGHRPGGAVGQAA
jgi:hypothetical protein